jgi:hypothetical protein
MSRLDFREARFRVILPVVYLVIAGSLFGNCFLHLGHSQWCQYFLNSMLPAALIGGVLSYVLVPWGVVQQGSAVWKILEEVLLVPLPFLLTMAQYYLIGLLIDRLLSNHLR